MNEPQVQVTNHNGFISGTIELLDHEAAIEVCATNLESYNCSSQSTFFHAVIISSALLLTPIAVTSTVQQPQTTVFYNIPSIEAGRAFTGTVSSKRANSVKTETLYEHDVNLSSMSTSLGIYPPIEGIYISKELDAAEYKEEVQSNMGEINHEKIVHFSFFALACISIVGFILYPFVVKIAAISSYWNFGIGLSASIIMAVAFGIDAFKASGVKK